jgi:acyl-CoA synthetase (AMP-forming)/AMP-acid ligase II
MGGKDVPFLGSRSSTAVALRDGSGEAVTYDELFDRAVAIGRSLPLRKSLIFHYAGNSVPDVVFLLGALARGHAVALLDPGLPEISRREVEDNHRPDLVWKSGEVETRAGCDRDIHHDLALLLSTSGSTGGSKFVRLTLGNLEANAASIAEALDISCHDVAAGHLPIHYSYGLSVLLSHLSRGAEVLLTSAGLMDRPFWSLMNDFNVSHFPGVPFHYETLLRLGLRRIVLPNLRVMTQAGGHLAVDKRSQVYEHMHSRGGRFQVMYGQTEASPRIATLAHRDFPKHPGSVGTAVPRGRIVIRDENGVALPSRVEGNIWYEGPNVMMGYAETAQDLARGDDCNGVLETGDIGWLSEDGHLTITGRSKRVGKVYGLRVNLDEIERVMSALHSPVAAIQGREKILLLVAATDGTVDASPFRDEFTRRFTLPLTAIEVRSIDQIPITSRGKTDYQALAALGLD